MLRTRAGLFGLRGRLSTSLRGMYSRWMVYLTCWRPSHSQWLTALAKLPELEYPSRRAHIAAVPDATRSPVLASQTVYHGTLLTQSAMGLPHLPLALHGVLGLLVDFPVGPLIGVLHGKADAHQGKAGQNQHHGGDELAVGDRAAQLGPALDAHSIQQACAQTGGCQHLQNGGFDFHAVSPFSTAGKKYSPIFSCGMCSTRQMAVISCGLQLPSFSGAFSRLFRVRGFRPANTASSCCLRS